MTARAGGDRARVKPRLAVLAWVVAVVSLAGFAAAWVLAAANHDADQTVAAFAARLKDAVDLDSVRDDLAGVVQHALEPAHISIWIGGRDAAG